MSLLSLEGRPKPADGLAQTCNDSREGGRERSGSTESDWLEMSARSHIGAYRKGARYE